MKFGKKEKTITGIVLAIVFFIVYWFLTSTYGEPEWLRYILIFIAGLGIWKLFDLSRIIKVNIHFHEGESRDETVFLK